MPRNERIGLGGLALTSAAIGIGVASTRPWPGGVTWFVAAVFLALAAGLAVILGRDMTRGRDSDEPPPPDEGPPEAPPDLPGGPYAIRISGGHHIRVSDNISYGRPVLGVDNVIDLEADRNTTIMPPESGPDEPAE